MKLKLIKNNQRLKMEIDNRIEEVRKLFEAGEVDRAESIALDILNEKNINNNQLVVIYNDLGVLYKEKGDFSQAIELFKKAILLSTEKDSSKIDFSKSLSNLASVYCHLGEYNNALELLKESMEINNKNDNVVEKQQGEITIKSNLASVNLALGNYGKAKDLQESVLATSLKIYPKEHPAIYTAMSNLAAVYSSIGDYSKAQELLENVLKEYSKIYSEEHSSIAITLSNLASVYSKLSKHKQAQELFEKALTILVKKFGNRHPSISTTMSNLAAVYAELGDYESAIKLFSQAHENNLANLGKDHPSTGITLYKLGIVNLNLGNLGTAKHQMQTAKNILLKTFDQEHPTIKDIDKNLLKISNYEYDPNSAATKSEAKERATKLVNSWSIGFAVTAWIPGASIAMTPVDISMIIKIGSIFGIKLDGRTASEIFTSVVVPLLTSKATITALDFIPVIGWAAKSAISVSVTQTVGKALIEYFNNRSTLPA